MSNNRFHAVETAFNRGSIEVSRPSKKISDYFAINTFTLDKMRKYLSERAYKSVVSSINSGTKIDRQVADQVASAMKSWAIEKGATHYTHWFQPLTGLTAEKHDTFFNHLDNSHGIEEFKGNELVQQEPDGSSFPTGGLRDTHEARGYTAWDPSSPAFVIEVGSSGMTLCIPTIFISYTGFALGNKAPLLKSINALEKAALPVVHLFDRNVKQVNTTLGWEQEYFLIDKSLYYARPDIAATGRTVVGRGPSKGQQLDDHYFGSIPERVYRYMLEFETEALKLGIPVKTRHNEVAPGQFECAPVFNEVNLSVDQNQLVMDVMNRVARRHNFRVLFHEKPFAGLNGSGKHNNWSMSTDTGVNLLAPGKTPKTTLQFLTFFICTIKAVYRYADVLRATIASAGNDHRLGANEAPPAIISVFIGSTLTKVLDNIEKTVKKGGVDDYDKMDIKLDIHNKIPDVLLDNTDRNRTSPFAFTGNKFEIRAVGSSANCALPMTVMNTIVAQQLFEFKQDVDALIKDGEKKDGAILRVLRRYVSDSKPILFEGDNYSEAWEKEAEKRGLPNIKSSAYALDAFVTEKAQDLFSANNIFSAEELNARYEVLLEHYKMKIQIEARILGEICTNQVIPATVAYVNQLIENIKGAESIGLKKAHSATQKKLAGIITEHINAIHEEVEAMIDERRKANKMDSAHDMARAYSDKVKPYFEGIRKRVDHLELLIADNLWPLPKYREMLFIK